MNAVEVIQFNICTDVIEHYEGSNARVFDNKEYKGVHIFNRGENASVTVTLRRGGSSGEMFIQFTVEPGERYCNTFKQFDYAAIAATDKYVVELYA